MFNRAGTVDTVRARLEVLNLTVRVVPFGKGQRHSLVLSDDFILTNRGVNPLNPAISA